MKVCDNADSDNRAAATNSTSLKNFLIRVQECRLGIPVSDPKRTFTWLRSRRSKSCSLMRRPAARTLSAWSVTSNVTIAAMTALWGLLASITSPRIAIAVAGFLMLGTPILLPRRDYALQRELESARSHA
jgi:hypothetical protein